MKKLSVLLLLFFVSCFSDGYKKIGNESFQLNYSNDKIFCTGNYLIYSNGDKKKKIKDGIWKYYNAEGKLEYIKEYKYNELVNFKEFNEFGIMIVSEIITDKTHILSRYYSNGNLKSERIRTSYIEESDEDNDLGQSFTYETEYSSSTIKNYYKNGQLKSQIEKDNGYGKNSIKIWDEKGNIILNKKNL